MNERELLQPQTDQIRVFISSKVLAKHVKHIVLPRCGELNCFGMVDAQIAAIESELLVN